MTIRCSASASVEFWHHTCAKPRKKRCSGVKPSTRRRGPSPSSVFSSAMKAMRTPPLSPMFSPSVSRPFRIRGLAGLRIVHGRVAGVLIGDARGALLERLARRPRSTSRSRLPLPSNLRPWSSKPCVSSWPITAPMPAEVHGVVRPAVEERRLQNAGREHDLGELRRVVGVRPSAASCPTRSCRRACPSLS